MTLINISSLTNQISERGLMTEVCLEGQKRTQDLCREFGDSTKVPITKVRIQKHFLFTINL